MAEASAVGLRNVGLTYPDGTHVLDNLTFSAQAGEMVAVLGPSGCGKSTLLRLIAGLHGPTAGKLDREIAQDRLGFVFQDPNLLPWANVTDNIGLPLRLRRTGRAERRRIAAHWGRRVGLGGDLHLRPYQLSGGMRMRVSLARAFTVEPELMLFDEPFAALDTFSRNHLNEELLRLKAQARWTAFFVTHSVSEAVFLADRLLLLSGKPARLLDDLSNPLPGPRTRATRESFAFQRRVGEITAAVDKTLPSDEPAA